MKRFIQILGCLLLPLMLMGASCVSSVQLQDFALSSSARAVGGFVGLILQLVLRAILPQTVIP